MIGIVFWFRHILQKRLLTALTQLCQYIGKRGEAIDTKTEPLVLAKCTPYEIQVINCEFQKLMDKLQKEYTYRAEAKKKQALFDLAAKVAHDVRSPLTVINMALKKIKNKIPQQQFNMMEDSVQRVHDIAHEMLDKNRLETNKKTDEQKETHSLPSLIQKTVAEARMQHSARENIKITFNMTANDYHKFVEVNLFKLKSSLSNLINNAVEAMHKGIVTIHLSQQGNNYVIHVVDNGKGIRPEVVKQLGAVKGLTYGKAKGNGLGLYHCKETLRTFGGDLKIHSELNVGTRVSLLLPKANPPSWFTHEIKLKSQDKIVILDDEGYIHQFWRDRFDSFKGEISTIEDFNSAIDFIGQQSQLNDKKHRHYFIDYEIGTESKKGLEVITDCNIAKQSYLVTNRYEDPRVLSQCQKLGIKLIPKNLLAFVPIVFESVKTGL